MTTLSQSCWFQLSSSAMSRKSLNTWLREYDIDRHRRSSWVQSGVIHIPWNLEVDGKPYFNHAFLNILYQTGRSDIHPWKKLPLIKWRNYEMSRVPPRRGSWQFNSSLVTSGVPQSRTESPPARMSPYMLNAYKHNKTPYRFIPWTLWPMS